MRSSPRRKDMKRVEPAPVRRGTELFVLDRTGLLAYLHRSHSADIDKICADSPVTEREALKALDYFHLLHQLKPDASEPLVALRDYCFYKGGLLQKECTVPREAALVSLALDDSYARRMYDFLLREVHPRLRD